LKLRSIQNHAIRTVLTTISEYRMIEYGDAVLVGVSGGPDSVALLYILHHLTNHFSLRLGVAHYNHGLRGDDAHRDEQFVATLADRLDLPFYSERGLAGTRAHTRRMSPEEAARELRYTFLYRVLEKGGFDRIAVGHHGDDNAELVLMFLLRGSGPLGISGIPPVRDACLIRPLIHLSRSEILKFLEDRKIFFVTDHTNTDLCYLRNRIRHDLMPRLNKRFNPETGRTLNRLSKIVRDEESWMEETLSPLYEMSVISEDRECVVMDAEFISRLHVAAQRRLLRRAVAGVKGDLRRITFQHIEAAVRLLAHKKGERMLHLPQRISLKCGRGRVVIQREQIPLRNLEKGADAPSFQAFEYLIPPDARVILREIDARLELSEIEAQKVPEGFGDSEQVAYMDRAQIKFPMVVRNYRPGDRFRPLGMTGSKKVKDFFIDHGVEKEIRSGIPLLVSNGKIVWIGGYRIDDTVKVGTSTTRVVEVRLIRPTTFSCLKPDDG